MNQQSAVREKLKISAAAIGQIRRFFAERDVIEVATPALSKAATTDLALSSLSATVKSLNGRLYLQTSPEHAMKRLLAQGSGDIYQLSRVYRDDELGRWHQPEFRLLEWYRVGFSEFDLMDEVYDLLKSILSPRYPRLARLDISFADAFVEKFNVDPHTLASNGRNRLVRGLADFDIDIPDEIGSNALLDLALSTAIAHDWPPATVVFLYDYPVSQAALAAIKPGDPPVAARFEVFIDTIEIANGFRELTDSAEQLTRFESDLNRRRADGMPEPPIDYEFLAALEAGLPDCAGVAIGIDRLMALLLGTDTLADAINFPHA